VESPLLRSLNPEQRRAVEVPEGPVLVLAGAGSGKTRVIAHRIAHLLADRHHSPHNLLAVTFTNKAAEAMKARVLALLQKESLPFLWMGTFHGICARILRADIETLGGPWTREFTIYDSDDSKNVVKAILKERGLSDPQNGPGVLQSAISRAKCEGLGPEALAARSRHGHSGPAAEVYREYSARLAAANAVDFDDLLLLALRVLEEQEAVRAAYQQRFHQILVDEYQDTNRIQYRLLRLLSGRWGNLFAVGDEDQSIYSWRGSDIQNILAFREDFPSAEVIRLERNYRSTSRILEAANALVAHNTSRLGKNLWTERSGGEPVRLFTAPTDREEAAFVGDTVRQLEAQGYGAAQMAVLFRTNAQSRTFEEAFLNRGVAYQIVGGLKFYERKEVKDIVAYLRAGLNPLDRVSLLRILNVPPRGLGKGAVEALEAACRDRGLTLWQAVKEAAAGDEMPARARTALKSLVALLEALATRASSSPPSALAEWVIGETAYVEYLQSQAGEGPDPETRMENLRELVSAMREFEAREGGDLRAFLERQALASDQDGLKNGAGDTTVKLMTFHAAKGLEYPVVFLVGLEEGFCPHQLSTESPDQVEEERRLCYVGMTRAMDRLYLCWARERYVFGAPQRRVPSPFLGEIPARLLEETGGLRMPEMTGFAAAAQALNEVRYVPLEPTFRPGARVHHAKFGFGTVLSVESDGEDAKVTVSFARFGKKKLLASLARLEVV